MSGEESLDNVVQSDGGFADVDTALKARDRNKCRYMWPAVECQKHMGGEGNVLRITSLELKADMFLQIQPDIYLIRYFDVYQVSLYIFAICAVLTYRPVNIQTTTANMQRHYTPKHVIGHLSPNLAFYYKEPRDALEKVKKDEHRNWFSTL